LVETAATVGLGSWFAASVVANVAPRDSWIRRTRVSWLFPEWRFFAPNPATHDYEVFCRFRTKDAGPTAPVVIRFPSRGVKNAVLNPHSRARKATRDAIEDVLQCARAIDVPNEHPSLSTAVATDLRGRSSGYVALLREAQRLAPRTNGPQHVQLGIVLVEGREPSRLLFVSTWEPVR
jgi:hypothetical protein